MAEKKLDDLPNELFLKIFKYLKGNEIFHAFHGLNSRFEGLIINISDWDMRAFSKRSINVLCELYLKLTKQLISLRHLTITLNGAQSFIDYKLNLDQFESLQSLTLCEINSYEILEKILSQCQTLQNLTNLKILNCYYHTPKEISLHWINTIWCLPKLTYFTINSFSLNRFMLNTLVKSSPTIKYVSIQVGSCSEEQLNALFRHTPNLEYFHLREFSDQEGCDFQLVTFPQFIVSLHLNLMKDFQFSEQMLQNLSNLENLILNVKMNLDGDQWQQILTTNLPKLKKFQLNMVFRCENRNDKENRVDQLLNSFRTKFWLETRQQFFRCIWLDSNFEGDILLHTMPGIIDELDNSEKRRFKSTCYDTQHLQFYDHIKTYRYDHEVMNRFNDLPACYPNISSIHLLKIRLPFTEDFFSKFVPTLNHLHSLEVTMDFRSNYSQLQWLIDQAPYLNLLSIKYFYDITTSQSFPTLSKSIRVLKLSNQAMTKSECEDIIKSSLGCQCETLTITLADYKCVLDFITQMPKLRRLKFTYERNKLDAKTPASNNKEMVDWLNEHVPSKSEYSRIDCSENSPDVQITIDRD